MVSPLDKNGGDIVGIEGANGGGVVQASADGQAVTYVSYGAFSDPRAAPIASQYAARRINGSGWLSQSIDLPTSSQTMHFGGSGTPYDAFSTDLSMGLVFGGSRGGSNLSRPVESPPLAGAPAGYENYYLNSIANGGALQPLLTNTPSVPPGEFGLEFLGSTPDLSHVIVRSSAALGGHPSEEPGHFNLYEWGGATGAFQLINVRPSGAVETIYPLFGGGSDRQDGAISKDGARVIWRGESALYMRESIGTDSARTVQIDAPGGEGSYLAADDAGTRVFFGDTQKLTATATASNGGVGNLYMYEPGAPEGAGLVDLTEDHIDPQGAEVQGVLGVSKDGSYAYFVANGVLASGASPGNCSIGGNSESRCNLYVWHEGEGTRFIATLSGDDERSNSVYNALGVAFDWSARLGVRTTRLSPDGRTLLFMSNQSLTGYDNRVSIGTSCGADALAHPLPAACEEVFLYEAGVGLTCISCNPNGTRPIGPSSIPGATNFNLVTGQYQSRALAQDGADKRVFFDSGDAVVPQDTNGKEDVYEYENGHTYLLSDGIDGNGARFVDASASGDDVFFISRAQLVGQDTDQLVDLYDVRAPHVPGEAVGFPAPAVTGACDGEECLPGAPSTPEYAPLSSLLLTGPESAPSTTPRSAIKAKPKKRSDKKPKKKPKKKKSGKKRRGD
jgi:hypothetical protein